MQKLFSMSSEDKIDKIYQNVSELCISLAKMEVRLEQHRTEINHHKTEIEEIKKYSNKTIGASAVIGGILAFIGSLIIKSF